MKMKTNYHEVCFYAMCLCVVVNAAIAVYGPPEAVQSSLWLGSGCGGLALWHWHKDQEYEH